MSFSSNKKFADRFGTKALSSKVLKKVNDPKDITQRGITGLAGFNKTWADIEEMPVGKMKFMAMSQLCALAVIPHDEVPADNVGMSIGIKEKSGWEFVTVNTLDGVAIRMIPKNRPNSVVRERGVEQCLTNLGYNPDFAFIFIEEAGDMNCDLKLLQEACKIIFDGEPNIFAGSPALRTVNASIIAMKNKWEMLQHRKVADTEFNSGHTMGAIFGDILSKAVVVKETV